MRFGPRLHYLRTYEKHSICYLVLTHSSAQNNHARLLCVDAEVIQFSDVANNIDDEPRVFVGMEVQHVS